MNDDWLSDGRKIPNQVMSYFRKRAVQAVREHKLSLEVVAKVFGFSRRCIYTWLTRYDRGGYEALESGQAPGAEAVITAEMDAWLEETVVNSTPIDGFFDCAGHRRCTDIPAVSIPRSVVGPQESHWS